LLNHDEEERDETIESQARCKLPRHDDGDTHWDEQKKQLRAL
jgi:hypothetical protein